MNKMLRRASAASLAVLVGCAIAYPEKQAAIAQQTNATLRAQVSTVSELSDVQPGDWAFGALQRLVEAYGCLAGYPNDSFRGDRALTRYEFAAGLNACLDVVVQLIGQDDDFAAIRRLQEEFAAELSMLRDRVDALEASATLLAAEQFSTTTRLQGLIDTHLVMPFGDNGLSTERSGVETAFSSDDLLTDLPTGSGERENGESATFEYWARLAIETSFTGADQLRVSVAASDTAGALANSESGLNEIGDRVGGAADNVGIDDLFYRFPVGDRVTAKLAANSVPPEDFVSSTIVPFSDDAVAAAGLPEFYTLYPSGAFGAGANIALSESLILDLAYLSDAGNENNDAQGLLKDYSYLAQLNLLTNGPIDAAIAYLDGDQSGAISAPNAIALTPRVRPAYTVAGLVSLDLGRLVIAGHYAYSPAEGIAGNLDSYMGGVAFPDLFGAGNELGLYGGISPAINRHPLLLEAYYTLNVNDFFTVTPAVIYTDSDSAASDDDNLYGALRASFSF